MVLRSLLVGGVLLSLSCGCGSQGNVAPVSGRILLNGKPVAEIAVTFQPIAQEGSNVPGPAAFGVTDADGRYTAKLITGESAGATVGKNQVRFSGYAAPTDMSEEGLAKAKPTVKIPPHYWYESKIEFDVPPKGTTTADFEIKSP